MSCYKLWGLIKCSVKNPTLLSFCLFFFFGAKQNNLKFFFKQETVDNRMAGLLGSLGQR